MNVVTKYFKTLPIGIAIVVILLVVIIILSLCQVDPMWPTFFCIFYFTTFAEMDIKRVPAMIVSGALGLFGGFITILVPDPTLGTILLLVWLLLLLTAGITTDPKVPLIDGPFMFLMLTVATAITGVCAASPALNIWMAFVAGIIVCTLIGLIMMVIAKRGAKKAAEKEAAAAQEAAAAPEAASE